MELLSDPQTYQSQRYAIVDYFKQHGSCKHNITELSQVYKIHDVYLMRQESKHPERGADYNNYQGDKCAWIWLFGEASLWMFPGVSPGKPSRPTSGASSTPDFKTETLRHKVSFLTEFVIEQIGAVEELRADISRQDDIFEEGRGHLEAMQRRLLGQQNAVIEVLQKQVEALGTQVHDLQRLVRLLQDMVSHGGREDPDDALIRENELF